MTKHPRRKSDAARRANQIIRSRTVLLMALFGVVTFVMLFIKLYQLQILRHDELEGKAVAQQTRSSVISASRGTIYDANGKIMAISATAETVNLSPKDIADYMTTQDEKIAAGKLKASQKKDEAYIARGLARILDVDEETIRKKMERTFSGYEIIKKKAEQAAANEVRRFVNGEIDDEGNEVPEGQRQSIQPQGRRSKVHQGLSRALSAPKPAAQTEAEGRRSKQTKCSDQHEFVSPFAAPAHFAGAAPVSLRFTVFFNSLYNTV